MEITVHLRDDLVQHANPGHEALESLAIEGYRAGTLTAYQIRLLLGFETRYELDGFLKEHDVWEHAYSVADLENDAAGFEPAHDRRSGHNSAELFVLIDEANLLLALFGRVAVPHTFFRVGAMNQLSF
jgi:hypothetical protein